MFGSENTAFLRKHLKKHKIGSNFSLTFTFDRIREFTSTDKTNLFQRLFISVFSEETHEVKDNKVKKQVQLTNLSIPYTSADHWKKIFTGNLTLKLQYVTSRVKKWVTSHKMT